MADPLSLLRQYNVNKRDIVEKNNFICFGEYCWPKTVKTNYLVWGSSKDGPTKEYYTLECLLFLLKNVSLQHPVYVKEAAAKQVPVVRRPDRKDLLAYLFGESAASQSIDRSAPLELAVSASDVLKAGDASAGDKNSAANASTDGSLTTDQDGASAAKISRLDVMQKAKEQFSARLDAPKIKKAISSTTAEDNIAGGDSAFTTSSTSLKEALSIAQISALKAKRLAKKRSTIIDAENEFEKDGSQNNSSSGGASMMLLKYDADFTREIQSKERIWRNRTTILQSSIKNFGKSIFPILQSIKLREEGSNRGSKPGPPAPAAPTPAVAATPVGQRLATPGATIQPQQLSTQQYNRYDQERFTKNDHSTIGFRIDTTGTYHGLTLKSVTEGSVPSKTPSTPNQQFQNPQSAQNTMSNNKPAKRTSKTPIIIIPATTTSLITMYNAKAVLQDLRFVEKKMAPDQKREDDILIQRRKPDNTTVPYRVIDNPLKLQHSDWDRVVAVFVQGPAWQFKGWPWDGNPVEIFAKIKAFHLKWDEMKLDANVSKWNVEIIELSRTKRHLDRANLLKFWSSLDAFMIKHKHHLRF